MRRSPGRTAASSSSRIASSPRRSHRAGAGDHSSWRRSLSPMHRGNMRRGGGRSFRRSPGRNRAKDDRSSPGAKKSFFRHTPRGRMQRRFSPTVRNRRRSLSRDRSASNSERRRLSPARNEDRGRPLDRSGKNFERGANKRSPLSPPMNKRHRSSSASPNARWHRAEGGGGGAERSHHDEMYQDMMSSRNESSGELGSKSRGGGGFSPDRSQQTSDIDERMQGRSPYRSDRFMDNDNRGDMNRNYTGDGQQMMMNEMSNNQGFQGLNFTSSGNRPAQDEYIDRDELNSSFNIMIHENPKPYTQEELKKITVDIFRNVPPADSASTNKRIIVNPEDVVIVRRSDEGARPIFDRDEIRQAQQAKDVTYERRVVAIVNDRRSHSPPVNPPTEFTGPEERENFQISSEHFNAYSNQNTSTRQSLNDRWQRLQMENMNADRQIMKNSRQLSPCRNIPYDHQRDNRSGSANERSRSRSRSPPISRRSDNRFTGRRSSFNDDRNRTRRYSSLYERRERFPSESSSAMRQFEQQQQQHDLRRKGSNQDQRPFRGRGGGNYNSSGSAARFRQRDERFEARLSADTHNDMRGDADKEKNWERGPDGEKLPNFSTRPDKYHYQEWLEKPDVVPKGPSYFEHDNRGERRSARGRGVGRGRSFRGGSFRSRGFTPRIRGGGGGGGASSGQSTYVPKNKWSPNHWQHDMFERSPDQNSVQDNNPSSTTGSK